MRQLSIFVLGVALAFHIFLGQAVEAKTLFEDAFDTGAGKWHLVDNGGKISVGKGEPPEYGPNVLLMESPEGINVLAFIKEGFDEFKDGIIEVLWRDKEIAEGAIADRDTDGPLIFRVQGQNWGALYLIEFDLDTGFHFDVVGGRGVVGGGPKSQGEWQWIKARVEGQNFRAKAWTASQDEPADWMLEMEDATFESGSVGLRAWSGTAEVALFRVSDLDGPNVAVDLQQKLTSIWGRLKVSH